MEAKKRIILESALDVTFETLANNTELLYGSKAERSRIYYDARRRANLSWRNSHQCNYHGCTEKTVKSHSLQRSGPLTYIAEDGHILSPSFDITLGRLEMRRVGINDASTFPGFCLEHEKMFSDFESQQSLTDEKHFRLQTYRTLCREIAVKKKEVQYLNQLLEKTKQRRSAEYLALLKKELGTDFFSEPNDNIKSIELTVKVPTEEKARKELHKAQTFLTKLENEFYYPMSANLSGNDFDGHVVLIDVQLPVALSGIGNFWFKKGKKSKSVTLVMNVIPESNRTVVIFFGRSENKTALKRICENVHF